MTEAAIVYVTCASLQEAQNIAGKLVGERLVACANILPGMISVYQWQDKIEQGNETVLILKTRKRLVDQVVARVKILHSYDCPAIIQIDITGGDADYIQWLMDETAG